MSPIRVIISPFQILIYLCIRFLVHPSAFLIHRAHRSTHAKNLVITAKAKAKEKSEQQQSKAPEDGESVDVEVHQGKDQREEWLWEQLLQQAAQKRANGLGIVDIDPGGDYDEEHEAAVHEAVKAEASEIHRRALLAEKATGTEGEDSIDDGATSTYAHTQTLGADVRRRMAEGTYEPHIDGAVRACLEKLSWWK